jgi:radical SAM protein with 4Fe4S-binding SPASM domain
MKTKRFKRIYTEITNECNLKCPFCLPLRRESKRMTPLMFREVAEKIKPYTDYIYLHVKGEPLLHPDFKDILGICNEYNLAVNITTNGTLIQKQEETLLSGHIRQLNISVHALTCFTEDVQIHYLIPIIRLIRKVTETHAFTVSLRFWLKEDHERLFALRYLEKELGVAISSESGQILPGVYVSYAEEFVWPEAETGESEFHFCHGITDQLGILADGTVVPCCLDGNGSVPLGNIFSASLEEILSGSRYQGMLTAFETRRMPESLCRKCSYKNRFS